ncbi:hypothetical protein BD626DRAFT_13754 [Schizophyllum amplum]|uniref:Uncharacterized protein n=1 Tax=Schizophyllum amplum TaxID=97359 RepID=A0A550CXJ9_9AGAR|nr:hypothetical protein BD626DRAFT_13754 [Auriculariopsis ampla]
MEQTLPMPALTMWAKQHRPAIIHFHGMPGQGDPEGVRKMAEFMSRGSLYTICSFPRRDGTHGPTALFFPFGSANGPGGGVGLAGAFFVDKGMPELPTPQQAANLMKMMQQTIAAKNATGNIGAGGMGPGAGMGAGGGMGGGMGPSGAMGAAGAMGGAGPTGGAGAMGGNVTGPPIGPAQVNAMQQFLQNPAKMGDFVRALPASTREMLSNAPQHLRGDMLRKLIMQQQVSLWRQRQQAQLGAGGGGAGMGAAGMGGAGMGGAAMGGGSMGGMGGGMGGGAGVGGAMGGMGDNGGMGAMNFGNAGFGQAPGFNADIMQSFAQRNAGSGGGL